MAINKNHEFEEINGIKCSVVEKNASPGRVEFLKKLLEFNNYTVVVAPSPVKPAVAPKPADPAQPPASPEAGNLPAQAETFTIGVTHVAFNPVNAIFGRLLQTPDGHIVTLDYWYQREEISNDQVPYYE